MTEKNLQKKIMQFCVNNDILCYKFASMSRRGVPDLLLINQGRALFMEVKHPNGSGRLSPLQKKEIQRIHDHGVTTYVVDDYDEACEKIKRLLLPDN